METMTYVRQADRRMNSKIDAGREILTNEWTYRDVRNKMSWPGTG